MGTERFISRRPLHARQGGAIAIIVALSLAVLIGFAGLALDLGRLFVNKTELQSAADACALAASNELVCDTSVAGANCPNQFLVNARSAGLYVGNRNMRDFQKSAASIAADDVKFSDALSPNANYRPVGGGANLQSKFVMCTARSTGIAAWFMSVLSPNAQAVSSDVAATAVATLLPSASFCDPAPMGVCSAGAAPSYGLVSGQWLKSQFTNANGDFGGGKFQWVDYTAVAGGVPDLRDILKGTKHFCDVKVGDDVQENGAKQGTKDAYNTRFGLYKVTGNTSIDDEAAAAPPDRTGYSYPTKNPAPAVIPASVTGMPADGQLSAYANYRSKQATSSAFDKNEYAGGKPANEPPPTADHARFGVQRRVLAAPIINCTGNVNKILAMGCVLMLNPMGNGASGDLYLEYLGLATAVSSPCRTAGVPAGAGGNGPLIPTLVQ